ncbi:hypothetical protein ALI144C_35890 [Actinosynnema sp. ALI-1.44]|uniref:hypothetical protein n=1 Tax=Actinosynnema sp. ALI-1.44 TaxID=1933779 RepID=UPI00097C3EAE|nr:hypothetical protein [Actinosynnema sp. ALI-1.44]ONI76082.1 hypothetical protein ALI144C_35890 [Actinosynnema sp. ALI-1.44]
MRTSKAMCLVALVVALLTALSVPAVATPPQGLRASYANPVLRSDGHVDPAATIERLQAMNADTYAFLILKDTSWDDLREFLPAAQSAGITVWVYLVPPTECPDVNVCDRYLPYKKDYEAWGRAIGTLAKQYPVLKAWAMDDFNHNQRFFTAEYTGKIRAAARAVQPSVEFYPVVYSAAITQAFVTSYAPVIDSVILPFRDDPYRNTLWSGSLRDQLDRLSALLARKNRKLILMVYASTLSATQVTPDVQYVSEVTEIGMQYAAAGKIAGVIQYALPLTPGRKQNGDASMSHGTGRGALVLTVRGDQPTAAGNYAAASTTVRLDPGSTSCRMVLWHTDNRTTNDPLSYHLKQALVSGHQVWGRDVASEGTDWYTSSPVDIAPHLSNGVGTLTLRLYQGKGVTNYAVVARFDDITLTGCQIVNPSFETTGGWTYTRSGGPVLAGQHTYDPEYSTSVHAAVGRLYARTA